MRNRLAPIVFSFGTLIVLLAVVYIVSSCSGPDAPDEAACRVAMSAQFDVSLDAAMAGRSAPAATRPEACEGVSDAAVAGIAEALIAEKLFNVSPAP
jgi:hypothetical protein